MPCNLRRSNAPVSLVLSCTSIRDGWRAGAGILCDGSGRYVRKKTEKQIVVEYVHASSPLTSRADAALPSSPGRQWQGSSWACACRVRLTDSYELAMP